jgi:atypical dual specificity phosphatase
MIECDMRVALNFSWLEDGLVAGCRGPRTNEDLAFLASIGIRSLVRLAAEPETGLSGPDVQRYAISDCYEPVPDWTAPSQKQIDRVVAFINNAVEKAEPVAVSCGAGYGRTGTVLGCYLVSKGLTAEAAIERLIVCRPCSKEILNVPGQKQAVIDFQRRTQKPDGSQHVV